MSSTASKVADIFTAAGAAFNRLGELTVQLHPLTSDGSAQASGKWGETEIEMLRDAVKRFGEDLKKISEIITTKSITQIKSALKQRMYEQSCGESATTPKKTSQKRGAKETTANGQNEGVAAKKIKQENAASSSEQPKDKLTSPLKETENEVDVESLEESTAAQIAQNSTSDTSKTGSEVTSSDVASS
ncbi:chromatin complexes subunit BAP18-like [Dendronephthya gigantea]|uniref:chromatin complexes subunit BAP18-like n=1 Tax=Dendronephthya gigantea TaxID=151771 RepID=UPI001068E71F|nr:chromatin complexes subunit BAP18-like [Dendronephthya gigantea]